MLLYCFSLLYAVAEPVKMSLVDSIQRLSTENPELQIARLQTDISNIQRLQTLSNAIPMVQATGTWLDYGTPLDVYLMGDGAQDVDCTSFASFGFGDLCNSFSQPLRLREDSIFDGKAQVVLPLSSLYSIIQGYNAQSHLHTISELQEQALTQKLTIQLIELYTKALEIEENIVVIDKTMARLQKHQQSISALVEVGMLHSVEKKRIEYAIHQAGAGKKQAQQGYTLLCEQIALLLGLEEGIIPIPITEKPIEATTEFILENNIAYQITEQQLYASRSAIKASVGELIPSVVLMGVTTKTSGQGPMTPTSQQYIGLSVQGNFQWGQKLLGVQQKRLQYQILSTALESQQKGLQLQQQAALHSWQQSKEQIQLAKELLDISRITKDQQTLLFQEQQITVSDVLEAETALAQAELGFIQAQLHSIVELAKYQQVLGIDILSVSSTPSH